MVGFARDMSRLRSIPGFLTREERLVFLTVSFCLLGGGLFHAALSLFDLPDALDPSAEQTSLSGSDALAGTPGRQSGGLTSVDGGVEAEGGVDGAGSVAAASSTGAPYTQGVGLVGSLELNAATRSELEALPGIGPALAGRILEHRARMGGFQRVEDLLDVSGIGEKTLSRFRAYVYVSASGR